MVKTVSGQELINIVESSPDKAVVVDMYADWCMPCRAAAPHYAKLAEKYGQKAIFLKINVDQEPMVAQSLGVMGVPSFFILKGKNIKAKIVGANMSALETNLKKELEPDDSNQYTAYL